MVQPKGCGWEDEEIPLGLITPESVWVLEKDSSIVSIEFESKMWASHHFSTLEPGFLTCLKLAAKAHMGREGSHY